MSPRQASESKGPRAPYRVGERVKVLWLEPGAGTVLGPGSVTACTPRAGGSGWRLAVAVDADRTETYLLSPAGHSDYVTPMFAETQRARRGHNFYPPPAIAAMLPAFYATENVDLDQKVLYLHYFAGSCDWWVAEYDPETGQAFGYASLGMAGCAEWGYFGLDQLERINTAGLVVERDLHWTPVPAREANLPD